MFIPNHDANHFTWNGNTGSTEISCLNTPTLHARLYATDPDFGFFVTGKHEKVTFIHKETVRDREGEITNWRYKSSCGRFNIIIFND